MQAKVVLDDIPLSVIQVRDAVVTYIHAALGQNPNFWVDSLALISQLHHVTLAIALFLVH